MNDSYQKLHYTVTNGRTTVAHKQHEDKQTHKQTTYNPTITLPVGFYQLTMGKDDLTVMNSRNRFICIHRELSRIED